jgi:hypothetical protein
MTALNQMPPRLSGSAAAVDKTLRTIANDPSAGLAISTAISTNLALANPSHVNDPADWFTLSNLSRLSAISAASSPMSLPPPTFAATS